MKRIKIMKLDLSSGTATRTVDYVGEEKPLHMFLNRTHYATIFWTPSNIKEMTIGHLLSEGL